MRYRFIIHWCTGRVIIPTRALYASPRLACLTPRWTKDSQTLTQHSGLKEEASWQCPQKAGSGIVITASIQIVISWVKEVTWSGPVQNEGKLPLPWEWRGKQPVAIFRDYLAYIPKFRFQKSVSIRKQEACGFVLDSSNWFSNIVTGLYAGNVHVWNWVG